MNIYKKLIVLIICTTLMFSLTKIINAANTNLTNLSPTKQKVINEFKRVSTIMKSEEKCFIYKKIIVKFNSTATETQILAFEKQFNLKNVSKLNDLGMYSYELSENDVISSDILIAINKLSIVEYAQPDYLYKSSNKDKNLSSTNFSDKKQKIINEFKKILKNIMLNQQYFSTEKIIVKFMSTATKLDISAFENEFKLKNKKKINTSNTYSYDLLEDTIISFDILNNINQSKIVEYAEPNYIYKGTIELDIGKQSTPFSKKQAVMDKFQNILTIILLKQKNFSNEKIIIKFASSATKCQISVFESEFKLKNKTKLNDSGIYLYELPDETIMSLDILENINQLSFIEYAEPDYIKNIAILF